MDDAPASGPGRMGRLRPPRPEQAVACVTAVRRDRYVEFAYTLGDPDLSVELVMPLDAFDAFCAERACKVATQSAPAAEALDALRRRASSTPFSAAHFSAARSPQR